MKKISRRDALKLMGVGIAGIAAAPYIRGKALAYAGGPHLPATWNPLDPKPQTQDSYSEKEVYRDEDVVIRQIDDHTWEGNGHLVYNESIYIIEGDERALLIDAGTRIKDLDKVVAGITSKPVTLVATHVHPDHTGSAVNCFPEIWICAADIINIPPQMMEDYKGKINYLADGQIFDLGGRGIEVIFTPGHTPGSVTFFETDGRNWGYSGDAFGSTNLLLTTNFSTLLATTTRVESYMRRHGIEKLYPGHYHGDNPETLQRISDLKRISQEMLDGSRRGEPDSGGSMGLNSFVHDFGVTVRYRDPEGLK